MLYTLKRANYKKKAPWNHLFKVVTGNTSVHSLSPLDSSVLEPNLNLGLSQAKSLCQISALSTNHVLLLLKLNLQCIQLLLREYCPCPLGIGHFIIQNISRLSLYRRLIPHIHDLFLFDNSCNGALRRRQNGINAEILEAIYLLGWRRVNVGLFVVRIVPAEITGIILNMIV